ncbi:NAD(P)-dependent oxidoreductase [Oricola thermophila]|uniref:NAD(P)-dependent oxidoreductase n=1 Tax=Oricola thermophila TaxID=2742145 RepID=A0A6N1VJ79_9HYPH|nr:NAD(P)-dependent oxidoreductase [Oricola thermophila]QKV19452.1 NAD(P)-dependent oxidoreductase [Oricola thermophila]
MDGTSRQIAFFGVGLMGAPMIRRLAATGHAVRAWNRTPERARAVEAGNVVACASPREAAEGADIAISMLSDGPAVLSLVAENDLADVLPEGTVFVDMSSARPGEARALAAELAKGGVAFCDAPVSGGPSGAGDGTLAIMAGCDPEVFERVRPVLSAMGRPTRVGPVGAGQLAKLANQLIVGAAIAAVAEATLLMREGGGDMDAFRDALAGGLADSKVLQLHGARMAAGDFAPHGRAVLHLKDMDNILAEAAGLGLELPLGNDIRARFARLCDELDGAGLDHSALFVELLDRNGRI